MEKNNMVRHIVLWNYADGFSPDENIHNAQKMKGLLEELPSLIDGIIELKVQINPMSSSNRDIMLDSLFESEEALTAYIVHPEHKRVGEFVRSVTKDRACVDYSDTNKCSSVKDCSCPKTECENNGKCCSCVIKHREGGNLPFCLRFISEDAVK
jgi:hypothetical protein